MSKPWTPRRPTVELRPSRIRREPVRLESQARIEKAAAISDEREIWGGVAGITLFAAALAVAIVGISAATIIRGVASAAHSPRFAQCYNSDHSDCVVDGDTIYLGGERVAIAGMDAPRIQGAACDRERSRGIDSALKLADILNTGPVTSGGDVREPDGRVRRKIEVGGSDVASKMIDSDAARMPGAGPQDWCSDSDSQ